MKNLILAFSLLCLSISTLTAQAEKKQQHPIFKETYKMVFEVQKNGSLRLLYFSNQNGKKISANITSPGDVPALKLPPGTRVEGPFKFFTFSGDGGLGGTRIYQGNGRGSLRIQKLTEKNGRKLQSAQKMQRRLSVRIK